jgi:hypothetical protein
LAHPSLRAIAVRKNGVASLAYGEAIQLRPAGAQKKARRSQQARRFFGAPAGARWIASLRSQ